MQNHFFATLLTAVLFLALIGAATHACAIVGGLSSEKMFRAARVFIVAGLFLFLTFFANYYLAAPAVGRFLGREKLTKLGDLGHLMFRHSKMRSNDIFALALVAGSFVMCALLLRHAGLFFAAVQNRSWQQSKSAFLVLLAKLTIVLAAACIFLWMDTSMLLFRSAMMMWPEEMSSSPADLPDPGMLIHNHAGTMGAYMLRLLACWYPLYILLAEKHFASCSARLAEASREMAMERARTRRGGAPTAPLPIVQMAPGIPPAPGVMPMVIPMPPRPTPAGAAPMGSNAPAPGGAAPFIRPIPFNPGPQNGRQP